MRKKIIRKLPFGKCPNCGYEGVLERTVLIGEGFAYWCPKCEYRVSEVKE